MKKVLGVEFAPLSVPLERRMQTLAAAAWFYCGVFGGPIGWLVTLLGLLLGPNWLRLLLVGYLVFVYLDWDTRLRGGRSKRWCTWFRNLAWWRYFCAYFPIRIVKTVDLDPKRNYLFCSFPHGLLCSGATGAFGTNGADCPKIFPGLDFRILTLEQHFKPPLYREYVCSFGACSCDEGSMNYLLSTKPTERDGPTEDPVQGRIVVIMVGGASEAFKCKPNTYSILVKRRKGFVRVALKNGTPLVPVFSFGETDLYNQMSSPEGSLVRRTQEFLKKATGVAPILPIGRGFFQYSFGLVPRRKPIHIVVGAPLEIPKIEKPTAEQIDEYHSKFVEKLVELFETHKSKYVRDHENTFLIMDD
ncbi:2-acylglycerol O-acyltransferase 1 [Copidosoma floridanum]|uniref:2-acylglycerol O-acyltransferase 1 n=1 Tax=Copidosoma floridanum TaxID=29053 RepID=UPI0006C9D69D|nr:2-acylglycerol O-acyltransferase 1 [Copidosoma floridanum]